MQSIADANTHRQGTGTRKPSACKNKWNAIRDMLIFDTVDNGWDFFFFKGTIANFYIKEYPLCYKTQQMTIAIFLC